MYYCRGTEDGKMSKSSLDHKQVKLLMVISLLLILSIPLFHPQRALAQSDSHDKKFEWDYDGKRWVWNLSIPKALYDAYKNVPVSTRIRNGPEGYGFLTTTQDYYIRTLAEKLKETAETQKYSSYDEASFVLAFVQSLNYTSDSVTSGYDEYPRFPIETLVDEGGDCEDTAVLFATLMLVLRYDTVYVSPPNHYAVGIYGENIRGSYLTYNNKTYYYCETTGNGFKIGDLPDEFTNSKFYIFTINESQQFIPDISKRAIQPTPAPTSSTKTPDPSQIVSPSPTTTTPTIQPILPLSFNLIMESPGLFVLIVLAIVVCIFLATKAPRRSKDSSLSQTVLQDEDESLSDDVEGKFCIYCGAGNKDYAAFCERCGKQIG